ncbi:MAG: ATP-binding cassette domain-containing protein [bacterium]
MIELQGVTYAYPGTGGQSVLDGLDLKVRSGEMLLLAGASGSGKSTLAFLLGGFIPSFLGGRLRGKAFLDNMELGLASPSELLPYLGLIMQNVDAQLFNPTVERELAFALESLGLPEKEILERIEKTTRMFSLDPLLQRSPAELSGGEKRLVAIAACACLPCPTMVLDEPLAHLDEVCSEKVKKALGHLRSQGRTVLIAEHRIQTLLEEVERCVILERGRVLFDGPPSQAREKLLQLGLVPTYPAKPPRDFSRARVVLEVKELHKRLGQRRILKDISFRLHQGEILAILGPNGAGKTTLIRHLNGLLSPDKGQVLLMGEPIAGKDPSALASQVGMVFQNPNDQFFCPSVKQEILAGPISRSSCSPQRLQSICEALGLVPLLERSPYKLSEGEKRRVAIATVLAMGSHILILDEPTSGQDGRSRMELAKLLIGLQAQGTSIVMVTHDRAFAQGVADRCLELEEGQIRPCTQVSLGLASCGV